MSKITKTYTIERKGDWVVASTPVLDRDRDRVMPRGIDTANFQNNPALFYGHIYDQPWSLIGRVAEWKIEDNNMTFRPELREPVNEADPMTIIRSLWDSGLLRAASIGFIPRNGAKNEAGGMDFTDVELLEISLVGLPANQTALRLAMKGLCADAKADAPAEEAPPPESPKPADNMQAVMDDLRAIVADLRELLKPESVSEEGAGDEENEPAGALLQDSKSVTKRGRVLSAGNESKLRTAYDAIGEVLSQLTDDSEQAGKSPMLSDETVAAMLGDLVKAFKP